MTPVPLVAFRDYAVFRVKQLAGGRLALLAAALLRAAPDRLRSAASQPPDAEHGHHPDNEPEPEGNSDAFVSQLRGLPMWISAAGGVPGEHDRPNSLIGAFNTGNAMGLEALARAQNRAFQVRLATLGIDTAHFSFPVQGTHTWGYWQDELWAMLPMMKSAIGA